MKWWSEIKLRENGTALWELGPLRLAVQHLPREWRLLYEHVEVSGDEDDQWSHQIVEDSEAPEYTEVERYVFGGTNNSLQILPALADRPVVSRPIVPFTVPAREEATIFVSTPLWAHIQVGSQSQTLQYLPIRRPSDTWFGPSTLEGELCYAGRTYGRLNLSEIPLRPFRAITEVLIRNRANSALHAERLSLPVPFLSLFATAAGRLWTEAVTMIRTRDSGQADLQIQNSPPEEAAETLKVASPREESGEALSIRAFGAILRDATRWS
jgi:hypothetical protein